MPRAWSIEELRRFEEIREGLRGRDQSASGATPRTTAQRPRQQRAQPRSPHRESRR